MKFGSNTFAHVCSKNTFLFQVICRRRETCRRSHSLEQNKDGHDTGKNTRFPKVDAECKEDDTCFIAKGIEKAVEILSQITAKPRFSVHLYSSTLSSVNRNSLSYSHWESSV
jgi:hypothetical protein